MYEVVLTERFKATHSLEDVRPRPHEHEWVIRITLASETLHPPGFVMNYYELKPLVTKNLPHNQYLNELFEFAPTGENLARHFYHLFKPNIPYLKSVSVGEFEDFMCTYAQRTN